MPLSSSRCGPSTSRFGVLLALVISLSQNNGGFHAAQAFLFPSASRCHQQRAGRLSPLQQSSPAAVIDADDVAGSGRSRLGRRRRKRKTDKTAEGDMVQMSFLGEKMVTTSPVPYTSSEDIHYFFGREKYRNLLFFRNDVATVTQPTHDMMRRWSSELKLGGGVELDNIAGSMKLGSNESILRIKTHLSMPGLKILTRNTIGAKLLLEQPSGGDTSCNLDTGLPEYQFTLLESELIPEGAPPLVWLFNKLTRFRDATSSFTRVRANNAGGVDCDKVIFTTEARLETRIQVPRKGMNALPGVDVAKFERQGSKSIQKLLEKELEPALNEFRDAYVRCFESKQ